MRSVPRLAATVAIVLAALAAACGGGSGSSSKTPTPGPGASDEQYLKVICAGTQAFSDALVSQTTTEGIAQSITDFAAALKAITPPEDLQSFHQEITKYLEDSVSDPTSLVTKKRPQPQQTVRDRLAAKELGVPECSKAHYFQQN